tara:strand:+ start:2288 stop:2914 length:627 start_codon:yes stop_codon:yes gene_type:complete
MKLFPYGIKVTQTEYTSLLHIESNPEQWLRNSILEKAKLRQEALINEWRPKLFADPDIAEIPANANALAQLIISHKDYKSRAQTNTESTPKEKPYHHNIDRFNGKIRRGIARIPSAATVTLFPNGIDLPSLDCNCILAYVENLDDWVLGALLGHINRGKKKMILEWQPKLFTDPKTSNIPANEEELIKIIVNLPNYKTQVELLRAEKI